MKLRNILISALILAISGDFIVMDIENSSLAYGKNISYQQNSMNSFNSYSQNVSLAYQHLDMAINRNGNDGYRLPSSFGMGGPLNDYTSSHIYDDALTIIAYLSRANKDDILKARTIGDTFIQLQLTDPVGDGRLRNSYNPSPLFINNGPNIDSAGSATGNLTWAGLSLIKLYKITNDNKYLDAAVRIGNFIEQYKTIDNLKGFTGGLNSDGTKILWKSTEHNIDAAAFYNQLYSITNNNEWLDNFENAKSFIKSMWNSDKKFFNVGTYNDGTVNTGDNPVEDIQSWSYLLLQDNQYAGSIDFIKNNLQVQDNKLKMIGVKFSTGGDKTNTIWFEGTAHTILAMEQQGSKTNLSIIENFKKGIVQAQLNGSNTNKKGIIASNHIGTAGGDDNIYPSLHIGTTAWMILAFNNVNPFK